MYVFIVLFLINTLEDKCEKGKFFCLFFYNGYKVLFGVLYYMEIIIERFKVYYEVMVVFVFGYFW